MPYDLDTLEFQKVLLLVKQFAKTNYAKECITDLYPSHSLDEVLTLQKQTSQAFEAIVKLSDLPLGGLYEVLPSIRRAQIGGILAPEELNRIVGLIQCTANVERYFATLVSMKLDISALEEYKNRFQQFKNLKTNITLAISDDGKVNDSASRELFTIRKSISSLENRLRSKLSEIMASKASMLTENLIVLRNNRMCLPVKIEYKNSFKGIVHDVSSSNTTCYIEPESTLETTNQIESYRAAEKNEIQNILKNLSLLVRAEAEELLGNLDALTKLDIIFAKAQMAKEYEYNPVQIVDTGYFNLKKAKHPLLAKEQVVPIDVELGKTYSTIIITGPNTGGKTVAMKTVGLLHLMALCGMWIPASKDSIVSIFDHILADIGDEQSIEQSLSTFSSHMKHMKEILSTANAFSLVLLDELGSGTDPKEGSSLAIAMIDYLKGRGAKTIVTTHYSDLKAYAFHQNDVLNASVEFNSTTLLPTYRLLIGVPGRSNAIEIASRLGICQEIIEGAKTYMERMDSSLSKDALENLEDKILAVQVQEEELKHKLEMNDRVYQELSYEKLKLSKQHDQILEKAKVEAAELIHKAKIEAESLLDQLKKMEHQEYKDHQLAEIKHKLKELNADTDTGNLFEDELSVGDYVFIKPYQQNGTITKIKKDKYSIQMGQFSMDFDRKDLIRAPKPKEKKLREKRLSGYNPTAHVGLSLDLRGKRYEEVKELMDTYLDQALLGNLESVSIIHGFGTGAIRKAVWEYLKTCPFVKSYRYGQEGEGLNGVTVVKLK